jgi:ribosomal protein S27E
MITQIGILWTNRTWTPGENAHFEYIECPRCKTEQTAIVLHTKPEFYRMHICTSCRRFIGAFNWKQKGRPPGMYGSEGKTVNNIQEMEKQEKCPHTNAQTFGEAPKSYTIKCFDCGRVVAVNFGDGKDLVFDGYKLTSFPPFADGWQPDNESTTLATDHPGASLANHATPVAAPSMETEPKPATQTDPEPIGTENPKGLGEVVAGVQGTLF